MFDFDKDEKKKLYGSYDYYKISNIVVLSGDCPIKRFDLQKDNSDLEKVATTLVEYAEAEDVSIGCCLDGYADNQRDKSVCWVNMNDLQLENKGQVTVNTTGYSSATSQANAMKIKGKIVL